MGSLAGSQAAAEPDALQVGLAAHLGDPLGRAAARVTVVHAVHVGEQDERFRVRDVGDERGQPVVVAEPDLVGGDRVVLVDHREHTKLEQPVQGALGVAVVGPAHQVIRAEQDLTGADAVLGEGRGVPGDEQALADAGRGLLGGQVARPPGQAQRDQAGRDRPGGDQYDLRPGAVAGGQGGGQGRDPVVGDLSGRGGQ